MTDTSAAVAAGIPTGQQQPILVSQAFGKMVFVMTQSPLHRQLFVGDLEWMLLPLIVAGNFRIFRAADGKSPAAFATWALVSDEVHARLSGADLRQGHTPRLQPADWTSGTHIWLTELCSPHGFLEQLVAEMKQADFKVGPLNMHVAGEWKVL